MLVGKTCAMVLTFVLTSGLGYDYTEEHPPPYVAAAKAYAAKPTLKIKADNGETIPKAVLKRTIEDTVMKFPEIGQHRNRNFIKLLVETAGVESYNGKFIYKRGVKDLGVFQIRYSTATDTLNWLKEYHAEVSQKLHKLRVKGETLKWNLIHNVQFGAALAALYYWRMSDNIHLKINTLPQRANLWRKKYNVNKDLKANQRYMERVHEVALL